MKIAIHERKGSFSDGWIEYCKKHNVDYIIVDCYDTDIVDKIRGCDGLMWHWDQNDYKAPLFARQLTQSLEKMGIKIFPDTNTAWHFDDKLGQKYLLEAVDAPYAKSYAFYTKKEAINWASEAKYPKVFKLRGGASGSNVTKVDNQKQARKLINKSFGRGFPHINKWKRVKDRIWYYRRDRNIASVRGVISGVARLFIPTQLEKFSGKEKGYVFFQDFIPNNTYDTRLIVVGNRCFGTRRYCKPNDFRASGSGLYDNSPDIFDKRCIEIAFQVAERLKTQSIAYDFIWDDNKPVICEISYIYCRDIIENCDGYWDNTLNWVEKKVSAEEFIVEDFINGLR